MTACAYRSLEPVVRQRLADLRERRDRDALFVDVARRVVERRIGRAIGGGVGIAIGGAAFLVALASFVCSGELSHRARVASTVLLLTAWPAALLSGATSRLVSRALGADVRVPLSGNPSIDLARLEAADPLRHACDVAMRWEQASAALPLAALSLVAPLTIHWIVWTVFSGSFPGVSKLEDFGTWIGISAIIVGHAHLALLVCAVRWACLLRARATGELCSDVTRSWGLALLVAGGAACLPGVVLLAIPPLLVLGTGLLFVPWMFIAMARGIERERFALEAS
jgi:hypothetical protein